MRNPVLQNTQQIALDIVNAPGGVIGIDDDAGNVGFGRFIGDVSNGVLHGGQGRRAVDHGGRQQQGDDAADDLAAGFVPAGELDPAMKPAEHQQNAGGQQQMACGQEPGDISTLRIEELMEELKEKYTVAIVTHNMQQAARIADYTAFFLVGEMVEFDETEKIFSNPADKRTEDYITGRFG